MEHLEGSGTSVLYIGRTVLKVYVLRFRPFTCTNCCKSVPVTLSHLFSMAQESN